MTLGGAIKAIRLQRGLRQIDVSVEAGYSETHICAIERDRCEPTISSLRQIAAALLVPVSAIFLLVEQDEVSDSTIAALALSIVEVPE